MLKDRDVAATVAVRSLERARPFYEDVLGLAPEDRAEMGVQTYRAGKTAVLVYESEFAGTNEATSLTWALGDDFDAVIDDLRSKGVGFERYDMDGAAFDDGVHRFGEMKLVWIKDPDGNIIHLGNFQA
jgi:catechol 2,3-dioxygenase-like lactoylglutathione lyase family enzyme